MEEESQCHRQTEKCSLLCRSVMMLQKLQVQRSMSDDARGPAFLWFLLAISSHLLSGLDNGRFSRDRHRFPVCMCV